MKVMGKQQVEKTYFDSVFSVPDDVTSWGLSHWIRLSVSEWVIFFDNIGVYLLAISKCKVNFLSERPITDDGISWGSVREMVTYREIMIKNK